LEVEEIMFGGLFGTVFGKIAAVLVTVGGVAGGMAATDALPMLGRLDVNTPVVVPVAGPGIAVPVQAGSALSFPDLPKLHQAVIDQGAQHLASTASTQALRTASQAEGKARQAAAAAQKCLDSLTAEVNALVAGVPGITNSEQAATMVAKARAIGENATACARQATALGQSGVDQINKAAAQLNSAVAQIGGLNLQNNANQVVQGAQDTLGTVTKNVDKSSGSALGMFGQITDMAAALMATAMEYQNKFNQTPGTPVVTNPVPAVPTVPTVNNPWGAFGDLSSWMALANQMQQAGGTTGTSRGTTSTTTNTGSNPGGDAGWSNWFSGR
jgi:phage shock protein A